MMHASIAVFTVKDVMPSLAYFRDELGFDVAEGVMTRALSVAKDLTPMAIGD